MNPFRQLWERLVHRHANARMDERQRRIREAHRLNVRIDTKEGRRIRRTRTARQGLRIAVLVLGLIVVGTAARAFIDKVYFENPKFQLGQLYIESDGDLTRPTILKHSGITRDDNLLDLDLERVRRKLAALPQVAEVKVERQLPDIVSIQVRERRPVAWLECPESEVVPHTSDKGWLIDAHGNVFPCEAQADLHMDLPIITTNDLPPLIGRIRIDSGRIPDALRLLSLSDERLYDEQLDILRIDCAREYSMIVLYRNDASVVFGTEEIEAQLDDLAAVLAFARSQGRQIATLNLMVGENKPVTFYESPTGWQDEQLSDASASVESPIQVPASGPLPSPAALPAEQGSPHAPSAESDVRAILGSLY